MTMQKIRPGKKTKQFLIFSLILFPVMTSCTHLPVTPGPIAITEGEVTVKLPDSSVYTGAISNGLFNGQGKLEWRNGDIYQGTFIDGLISGKGQIKNISGEEYSGDFASGLYEGKGKLRTTAGDEYEGDFKNGNFHGEGVFKAKNGVVFKGQFKDGVASGQGTITWTNGSTYKGNIKNWRMEGEGEMQEFNVGVYKGDFVDGYYHGQGTFEYLQGDVYVGEFKQGAMSGKGKLSKKSGLIYEGEFLNGMFHGKGEMIDTYGKVYEGDFVLGELSGKGEIIYTDGTQYSGDIDKWLQHGKGTLRFSDKTVYDGAFEKGLMTGKGKLTTADGSSYSGEFKNNYYDGNGELIYKNGDRYVGGFKQGVRHGNGTYYYKKPKGKKKHFEGEWNEGVLVLQDGEKIERKQEKRDKLFVEETLYQQYPMINRSLQTIAKGHPDVPELYFLSFGSYADQDVFMKEAVFSRDLFDKNYGTVNRSIALINNKATFDEYPAATVGNLKRALNDIGAKMNKEEDILFLFVSSHGSKDYGISVRLGGLYLEDLSASHLSSILKESGIKWKVIVISACYSGAFIDTLKDDYTMLMTSSKPDHVSFGCSDDAEFTFFGRALFKHALKESDSFDKAFEKAKQLVDTWETEKEYSHSEPQFFTTSGIEQALSNWRKTIRSSSLSARRPSSM